jgi:PKD domain
VLCGGWRLMPGWVVRLARRGRAPRPALQVVGCVGVLTFVVALQPASASVSAAVVWPGSVVTYRDLTRGKEFHGAVAAAVKAWNRLKVGVKLERVHGQANVKISLARGRCLGGRAGTAPLGFRTTFSRIVLSRSCPVVVRKLLIAHELGRALGLPVDNSGCSLMNGKAVSDGLTYVLPAKCSRTHPPRWLRRLIDPGTAATARLMYRPPLPPGAVALSVNGQGLPELTWAQASDATAATTVVARTPARCPTDRDVAAGTLVPVFAATAVAGSHTVVDSGFPQTGGAQCYRVFDLNRFGRTADSPDAISYVFGGPIAGFTITGNPAAGTATQFDDTSTVPQGSVIHWTWGFGDPASGAANVVDTTNPAVGRTPTHVFTAAGTYDVSLTVVDTAGLASSIFQQVVVGAAS